MNIREAAPEEYERARQLMLAAYAQYAPAMPEAAWEGYAADIADLESRLPVSELLVADDEGTLAGAVTYYPGSSGGGYGESWPPGWPGFRLLAVAPEHRGRGLGRALTQACIDRARAEGAPGIALGTTALMAVARAMYERMGFQHRPEYDWSPRAGVTVSVYALAFPDHG